ncbi:MAG TPA: sulfatase [Thermoanaerobaculia bacterium]|nr:sulfatase [Thermoanaerobaculia bacterium]
MISKSAAALALALGLAGCAHEDSVLREGALTPRFATGAPREIKIWTAAGARSLKLEKHQRIRLGTSDRQAVLTLSGVTWKLPVGAAACNLSISLGAVADPNDPQPTAARIDLVDKGKAASLLDVSLHPGDGWISRRLEIPAGRRSRRLVLSSEGPAPIAWAELYDNRPPGPAVAKRPNLVFVIIDTVRADHLSTYGYRRPTSPNLSRLASRSLLFRNSYSASTWTLPSTASLMTGLYPDQHGVRSLRDLLPPKADTLAERLQALGYRTAAFTDGGFVDPQWGFAQGFDRYDSTRGQAWSPKDVGRVVEPAARWLAERSAEVAAGGAGSTAPFFLFVHTYEAHQPYLNREGLADMFLPPGPKPRDEAYWIHFPARIAGPELARVIALYDGEIRRADRYLATIWRALGRKEFASRTAILVTSDHGEELMEHGNLEHGMGKLYDENIKVPLILRLPDGSRGTAASPVSGVDVVPTFLDLAGAPKADLEALPGRSLLALAADPQAREAPHEIVAEGLNSFHQTHERRYRLDQGETTLLFDAVRRRAQVYDRAHDAAMRAPRAVIGSDAPEVARLQTALAWFGGPRTVRLPEEISGLVIPRASRVAPLAVWDGLDERTLPRPGHPVALTLGRPHALSFTILPGTGEISLRLFRLGDPRPELVRLEDRGATPSGAPFIGPLPALAKILVGLQIGRTGTSRLEDLDEEGRAELRALGYLR